MKLTEAITDAFYTWESYLRGTKIYNYPVDIEPPFIYGSYLPIRIEQELTDDGAVPSLFTRFKNLFQNAPDNVSPLSDEYDWEVQEQKSHSKLTALVLKLNYANPIYIKAAYEFLSLLSQSSNQISFELIAQGSELKVQFVCPKNEAKGILALASVYLENFEFIEEESTLPFYLEEENALIIDLGLAEEVMVPLKECQSFDIDPLSALFSVFKTLTQDEVCMLQVLFKSVQKPWSKEIIHAVTDNNGDSIFADAPEMSKFASQKTSSPLLSTIVRLVVQAKNANRSEEIASHAVYALENISKGKSNSVMALSNIGYHFLDHYYCVEHRMSQRLGFFTNISELLTFVHIPSPSLVRLNNHDIRHTKKVPLLCTNKKYCIGKNYHEGAIESVTLDDSSRLSHSHIIGATGTGKSTTIIQLLLEDIKHGNGAMLIDPHGDVVDDIIARIPANRLDDVFVLDPSDMNFPIGFNLLEAKTEQEKLLLSSDLIDLFRRESTSWGDVMTSVLSHSINAFLESSHGGTLFDLKQFLIQEDFRKNFLASIHDPIIQNYFLYEFSAIKRNAIAPLLTRLDSFLGPKILRNMFIQKNGVNFNELISQRKILLVKLSIGLIGQRNASFLGSLLITKMNQAAFARQSINRENRNPFYLYIDEFHNVVTESIDALLSGSRKYGLGLILAHQSLSQLKYKSDQILQSLLNNANINIVFRANEQDALTLSKVFSSFSKEDIMSQNTGQAYMRVGSSHNDFSLETLPLDTITKQDFSTRMEQVISQTRTKYGTNIKDINSLIDNLYRNNLEITSPKNEINVESIEEEIIEAEAIETKTEQAKEADDSFNERAQSYISNEEQKEEIREHLFLQNLCQQLGHERGFLVELEKQLDDGGRVDVHLQNNHYVIACEITVTNSSDYEVKNIQKCLKSNYNMVICVSQNKKHLQAIENKLIKLLEAEEKKKVLFCNPKQLPQHLDAFILNEPKEKTIRGYKVKISRRQ